MPFLLAEILNFQGSTHQYGVGSFSKLYIADCIPQSLSNQGLRFFLSKTVFADAFILKEW